MTHAESERGRATALPHTVVHKQARVGRLTNDIDAHGGIVHIIYIYIYDFDILNDIFSLLICAAASFHHTDTPLPGRVTCSVRGTIPTTATAKVGSG